MTRISKSLRIVLNCVCCIATTSIIAENITPDGKQVKEKEKNASVMTVEPDKKENSSEVANAEQNAFQETNRQFERMQQYGTPVGEDGPIPMDYDTDYDDELQNQQNTTLERN